MANPALGAVADIARVLSYVFILVLLVGIGMGLFSKGWTVAIVGAVGAAVAFIAYKVVKSSLT